MDKKFGFNPYTFLIVIGFWIVGSIALKTVTVLLAEKGVPFMDKAAMVVHTA